MSPPRAAPVAPLLVAAAGWLVPGAGYWLIGHRARALVVGISILVLFVLGVFLSGVRVIDVPGYDASGTRIKVDPTGRRAMDGEGQWVLLRGRGLVAEVADKPWFVPQVVAGPITLISAALSVQAAQQGVPRVHARLADIGTLYTAIAGMLNLMAIIDAAHRASHANDGQDIEQEPQPGTAAG